MSKKTLTTKLALALSAATLALTGVATADTVQFKRNKIKFQNSNFFIRDAAKVKIGTWGTKRTPATQQNYVQNEGQFRQVGRLIKNGPHSAQFDSNFSLAHIGSFAMPIEVVNLDIDSDGMLEMMRNGDCTFEHISVNLNPLKNKLNQSSIRHTLKLDDSYRIVTEVIRVKSCDINRSSNGSLNVVGSLKIPAANAQLDGDDTITGSGHTNFSYAPNTVVAYKLGKFEWDKTRKNKRNKITRILIDNRGLN